MTKIESGGKEQQNFLPKTETLKPLPDRSEPEVKTKEIILEEEKKETKQVIEEIGEFFRDLIEKIYTERAEARQAGKMNEVNEMERQIIELDTLAKKFLLEGIIDEKLITKIQQTPTRDEVSYRKEAERMEKLASKDNLDDYHRLLYNKRATDYKNKQLEEENKRKKWGDWLENKAPQIIEVLKSIPKKEIEGWLSEKKKWLDKERGLEKKQE